MHPIQASPEAQSSSPVWPLASTLAPAPMRGTDSPGRNAMSMLLQPQNFHFHLFRGLCASSLMLAH